MTMIVYPDRKNHFRDSFTGYMSPAANVRNLVAGEDYTQWMTVNAELFPAGTVFDFAWPDNPRNLVRSYNHIAFGNMLVTKPPKPIAARRISEVTELKQMVDLTIDGYLDGFGVITDLFLTEEPGRFAIKTEVMVAHHTPPSALAWYQSGEKIGRYVDSADRAWSIYDFTEGFRKIVFEPSGSKPTLEGTFDLLDMLRFLVANGFLTGSEYYNGHGIGAEPKQGGGQLVVNRFDVSYA